MGEPRLQAVGVVGALHFHDAVRAADHHVDLALASEHIAGLGRLVDKLVHAGGQAVGKPHVNDGPHPRQGRAHGAGDDGCLGDGGVQHMAGVAAQQLLQAQIVTEAAAPAVEVLRHDEHGGVSLYFLRQHFQRGVLISHDAHSRASSQS